MVTETRDWADEERPADRGRRRFLGATLLAGSAAVVGTLVATGKSLIPPPVVFEGTIENGFRFGVPDNPNLWFSRYANQPVRMSVFKLWQGASVLWRTVFDEAGSAIPGTGYPSMVICVESSLVRTPPEFESYVIRKDVDGVPAAFVALYARCVHFCCKPGWHQYPVPSSLHDYVAEPRTFLATDPATGAPDPQDPIWCQCHNSQYDPVTIVNGTHPPPVIVDYIGARYVHGPATRALPAIPLRAVGDALEGVYEPDEGGHPEWYSAYCR